MPQMDSAELQATLTPGQALLILVQPPATKTAGDAASQATPAAAVQALLLRRDSVQLHPLPGLGSAASAMRWLNAAGQAQPGARFGGWRDATPVAEAVTDAPDATSMTDALWTPLAPHLVGIHTLDLVTHGELHSLPLQHGAPEGLRILQVPGLVFHWLQQRQRAGEVRATAAAASVAADPPMVALQAHSPAEDDPLPPIPFVKAEEQALKALWGNVQNPIELQRPMHVPVLHLAGHGDAGQGGDAGVLIGPGQTLGLHELLRSGLRADTVFLSACLVGKTVDDIDGDPLGMVSGLFLRGVRSVVAPLVPISDFHAPLLAILYHLALRNEHQQCGRWDAHHALGQAKAQLASGEWPEEAEAVVRAAYQPVIARRLERALSEEDRIGEVRRMVGAWLHPMCTMSQIRAPGGPEHRMLEQGAGAQAGAQAVLDLLLGARERLHLSAGVQQLLHYVSVYGAGAH